MTILILPWLYFLCVRTHRDELDRRAALHAARLVLEDERALARGVPAGWTPQDVRLWSKLAQGAATTWWRPRMPLLCKLSVARNRVGGVRVWCVNHSPRRPM